MLDKKYERVDLSASELEGTGQPKGTQLHPDTSDVANYTGNLFTTQHDMAADENLPNIRLWAVPFIILERPLNYVDNASDTSQLLNVMLKMTWLGHTQLSTPKQYTVETKN